MDSDWPVISLAEAGVELIDCVHKTPPEATTGMPYLTIPQMKSGVIDLSDARLIAPHHFDQWTQKVSPLGHDVVLSRRCNPGVTAAVPPGVRFALGQNLVLLRADGSKVFPPFLKWLVCGPFWWEQVGNHLNAGAVFDSLKCADVPKFELPVPPLDEQRRIAAILGALDDKIELNRRMNKTLEEMAQAIFKSWFIDFDGHTDFVDSDLGRIPRGWRTPPLQDLTAPGTTITYGVVKPGPEDERGVLFIRSGDIRDGWIAVDELRTISQQVSDQYRRTLLKGGELLVSLVGNPGEVSLVPGFLAGTNIARQVGLIRFQNPHLGLLVRHYLRSQAGRSHLLAHSRGSVQQVVNLRELKTVRVPIPPLATLERALTVLEPLHMRMIANHVACRSLAQMRDALLPKLISGELRVPEAETAVEAVA